MWILVWLSFIDNKFEHYQLGAFGTEAHCNKAIFPKNNKIVIITSNKRIAEHYYAGNSY